MLHFLRIGTISSDSFLFRLVVSDVGCVRSAAIKFKNYKVKKIKWSYWKILNSYSKNNGKVKIKRNNDELVLNLKF